jgi:copper chaperone CopZ
VAAREAVGELKGVLSVTVDVERKEAVARLDGTGAGKEDVVKALAAAGFAVGDPVVVEEPPPPGESPAGPP